MVHTNKKSDTNTRSSTVSDDVLWLRVIGNSLAYRRLHSSEMKDETMGEQARFLTSLGLPRENVAAMLNSTEDSVRVQMAKKRGKKAKSTRKGK